RAHVSLLATAVIPALSSVSSTLFTTGANLGAADCSHVASAQRPLVCEGRAGSAKSGQSVSGEALLQALQEDILRQIDADEHHLAGLLLARRPFGAEVAAHQLVDALEDDL